MRGQPGYAHALTSKKKVSSTEDPSTPQDCCRSAETAKLDVQAIQNPDAEGCIHRRQLLGGRHRDGVDEGRKQHQDRRRFKVGYCRSQDDQHADKPENERPGGSGSAVRAETNRPAVRSMPAS